MLSDADPAKFELPISQALFLGQCVTQSAQAFSSVVWSFKLGNFMSFCLCNWLARRLFVHRTRRHYFHLDWIDSLPLGNAFREPLPDAERVVSALDRSNDVRSLSRDQSQVSTTDFKGSNVWNSHHFSRRQSCSNDPHSSHRPRQQRSNCPLASRLGKVLPVSFLLFDRYNRS